ncbi:MAG: Protein-N(5)-glutamine methyltransferase PrmC [Myxococcaceae bacterium]|nr:Protein-N(5)-glutamine methyltransferase PrmC [Myxococcaceae bacterium]
MTLPPIDRLALLTPDQADALRARLTAVGYDADAIARGESIAPGLFDALRLPLVHDALPLDDAPASDLALLFAYSAAVPFARVERALTPALAALALDLGLVVRDARGDARSPFLFMPFMGLWILSDPLSQDGDAVMGPGPTTDEIARLLPRTPPPSVLDVGCGAGTLALVAADRGCPGAVGIDINPRAVEMARFNARLHGLSAEFLAGDLFAPVAGRRFDLVVSQPPFVARPPAIGEAVFLYGGEYGDEFAVSMIAQTPPMLTPSGRALILLDAPVRPEAALHLRLRAALGDAPVDVAVFAAPGMSPDHMSVGYSARSLASLESYPADVRRYRRHLRALGVAEFSHAVVLLLPPGGRFTISLNVRSIRAIDGDDLARWCDAIDLASGSDAALLDATLRPAPGLVFVEERATPDRSVVPTWRARSERGIAASRELSEASWALLEAITAVGTVGDGVAAYAEMCGATAADVRGQVLAFVREHLAKATLVVARE